MYSSSRSVLVYSQCTGAPSVLLLPTPQSVSNCWADHTRGVLVDLVVCKVIWMYPKICENHNKMWWFCSFFVKIWTLEQSGWWILYFWFLFCSLNKVKIKNWWLIVENKTFLISFIEFLSFQWILLTVNYKVMVCHFIGSNLWQIFV